jgi:hypothetical protein
MEYALFLGDMDILCQKKNKKRATLDTYEMEKQKLSSINRGEMNKQ